MKKIFLLLFIVASSISIMATTTGSTARNVSIDGSIGATVANGTNGTSWEINEKASNTTSTNVDFYLTWDDTYLYLAYGGTLNNITQALVERSIDILSIQH